MSVLRKTRPGPGHVTCRVGVEPCRPSGCPSPQPAYLHIHDVVVDSELVLLQHPQQRLHCLPGSEELQVGLWGRQVPSHHPGPLQAASSVLSDTSQMPALTVPREGPTCTGVAGHKASGRAPAAWIQYDCGVGRYVSQREGSRHVELLSWTGRRPLPPAPSQGRARRSHFRRCRGGPVWQAKACHIPASPPTGRAVTVASRASPAATDARRLGWVRFSSFTLRPIILQGGPRYPSATDREVQGSSAAELHQ